MTTCIRRKFSTWSLCECDTCRQRRRRTDKARRCGLLTPPRSDDAWERIHEWTGKGWTAEAIESVTGISKNYVNTQLNLYRNHTPHEWGRGPAEAILGATGFPTAGSVYAWPYTRRLQALAALGWSLQSLSVETGIGVTTLAAIREPRVKRVRAAFASAIYDTYQRLHMTIAPEGISARHTRGSATRAGWAPPLAWTDIDQLDDEPTGLREPLRRADQQLDRIDHLEQLAATGATLTDATTELHITRDGLRKWARHNDAGHLIEALERNSLELRETA